MTTHEHDTELTRSYDDSRTNPADANSGSEHPAAQAPADPSRDPVGPQESSDAPAPAVGEEHRASQSSAAEPTAAAGRPALEDDASAGPAQHSTEQHETSTSQSLFGGDELAGFRAHWAGVQAAFVDDPRDCVQKADALVSELVERLTTGFARARSRLEEQWARGEEASTEDLRVALMHYREFFERLLAV